MRTLPGQLQMPVAMPAGTSQRRPEAQRHASLAGVHVISHDVPVPKDARHS
jgi:hypothetical protein